MHNCCQFIDLYRSHSSQPMIQAQGLQRVCGDLVSDNLDKKLLPG